MLQQTNNKYINNKQKNKEKKNKNTVHCNCNCCSSNGSKPNQKEKKPFSNGFSLFIVVFPGAVSVVFVFVAEIFVTLVNFVGSAL